MNVRLTLTTVVLVALCAAAAAATAPIVRVSLSNSARSGYIVASS